MSKSKSIIVRVQSPDHGTKRVEAKQNETIVDFLKKLQTEFGLGDDTGWNVYKSRDKKDWIRTSRARTLDSYKVRHGDMLYLFMANTLTKSSEFSNIAQNIEATPGPSSSGLTSPIPGQGVIEDEVDQILDKEDGKIYRKRNEQLCHHGPQGKCLHCVPLMPYDEEFLHSCDPPIKFLSFHSHLRKLTGGVDK